MEGYLLIFSFLGVICLAYFFGVCKTVIVDLTFGITAFTVNTADSLICGEDDLLTFNTRASCDY